MFYQNLIETNTANEQSIVLSLHYYSCSLSIYFSNSKIFVDFYFSLFKPKRSIFAVSSPSQSAGRDQWYTVFFSLLCKEEA